MSKMTDRMNSIIGFVPKKKKQAEGALQAIGGQIRKNVDQGQVDLKSGKIGRNDFINPLKGTRTAAIDALKNGQGK